MRGGTLPVGSASKVGSKIRLVSKFHSISNQFYYDRSLNLPSRISPFSFSTWIFVPECGRRETLNWTYEIDHFVHRDDLFHRFDVLILDVRSYATARFCKQGRFKETTPSRVSLDHSLDSNYDRSSNFPRRQIIRWSRFLYLNAGAGKPCTGHTSPIISFIGRIFFMKLISLSLMFGRTLPRGSAIFLNERLFPKK